MNVEEYILQAITERGAVTPAEVAEHTAVSRQRVYQATQRLMREGKIIRTGATSRLRYVAPSEELRAAIAGRPLNFVRRYSTRALSESEVFNELGRTTNILELLSTNVVDIARYAFTEMVNNAIDHSGAKTVDINAARTAERLEFEVKDRGVGILKNLRQKLGVSDDREAFLELVKGKLTTQPDSHSGQGIFFTSRAVDIFTIESGRLRITVNNAIDDIFLQSKAYRDGTIVRFTISTNSQRSLASVFDRFSSSEEGFFGTEYKIRLVAMDDAFVSRSQAKQVLHGMDRFKVVTLDFAGVRLVGQGFADEVLRVWQRQHPQVRIEWVNANADIEFMMRRATQA